MTAGENSKMKVDVAISDFCFLKKPTASSVDTVSRLFKD